jgi:hypothetical protein
MSSLNDMQRRALSVEDYYFQRKLDTRSAWYNPATKPVRAGDVTLEPECIYIGESGGAPTWEEPVFDVGRYRQALALYREGRIDDDRLKYTPWRFDPRWEELVKIETDVYKYGRQAMNQYRSGAGVVLSTDSTAINVIQILGEVQGTTERQYSMEEAVTRIATPNLSLSIDKWAGFAASSDVGEGVEALVKKGKITRTEYLLKKDVGHIMVTDEAQLRADRDVFTLHVNHAVRDLRRLKATKIATELETATPVSGADFGALGTYYSTNDPLDLIGTVGDTIEGNGGTVNTFASHGKALRDFMGNTHVSGVGPNPSPATFGAKTVGNIPGFPGVTWYVDNLLSQTLLSIYDKAGIMLMQGPVRTAQYRIEPRGMDAYITRDYNTCEIVDTDIVRNLTTVTA